MLIRAKDALGQDKLKSSIIQMVRMYFLLFAFGPNASGIALQHGGFVPGEWLAEGSRRKEKKRLTFLRPKVKNFNSFTPND